MAFSIEDKLGSHAILTSIGTGGVGEFYRAFAVRMSNFFFACLAVFAACVPVAAQSTALTYVPGSSVKLYQINGDCDWVQWDATIASSERTCKRTVSQTATNADVLGDDVASSFEHNGELIMTFGDTIGTGSTYYPTWTSVQNTFGWGAHDPIARSTTQNAQDGLLLNFFLKGNHGLEVVPPPQPNGNAVDMGIDNIPLGGISLDGQIYIVVKSGTVPVTAGTQDQSHDYSVLTTFNEASETFTSGRTISQLPGGHFIKLSLHEASPGLLGTPAPVSPEPDVVMFGQGSHNASNIYLAIIPKSEFASGVDSSGNGATRYFTGLSQGKPTWSASESAAVPVVTDIDPANPTIGNSSAFYSQQLGLWLMTFDGGRGSLSTKGVYFTYAPQPWGPWSTPQLVFNDCRDKGLGNFIFYYYPTAAANNCPSAMPAGVTSAPNSSGPSGPTIGDQTANNPLTTRGDSYAPLMVQRFTTITGDTLKIYYTLATWNPYAVVLMESDFTIAGCQYSLSSGGQVFLPSGGPGSVTITTSPGCPWNVSGLPSWVVLTGASSGTGSGTVTFQVFSNADGDVSTSFTIAGQTVTFEQEAASIPGLTPAGSLGQVASEGTWDFSLMAINLGASSATARFTFAGDNGSPLMLPLTFPQLPPAAGPELASTLDRTLVPNAQIVMESTGPDSATTLVGSGQLLSNGNVSGFGIFSNPKVHWNAVVPLETRNASKYILAFDNTGAVTTGLAIANLAALQQNVQVIIRDDTGLPIGNNPPITLKALGHAYFMLNDPTLGFPVTNNKRGTIEFDTPPGGQISVLGLRANGPALTTLPVLANVGTGGGSITHVAYNGGWTSVFYIANTGNASAQFTLSFFDENGIVLPVPLSLPQSGTMTVPAPTFTRTLAAGAMLLVEAQAQDAQNLVVGSAQLATTGNISGFEIFRWNTFGQEASVPLETRTPNSFVLVFDDTNGLTTGVALASTFGLPVNVTATVRDDTGAQIGVPQTINLAARGHTQFLLPNLYSATAGKRGMVEFAAPQGQTFSVIGLRAKSSDGTLTTIPVLTK